MCNLVQVKNKYFYAALNQVLEDNQIIVTLQSDPPLEPQGHPPGVGRRAGPQ